MVEYLKFRYLTPREGTETRDSFILKHFNFRSDALFPARGRKQSGSFSCACCGACSDTSFPARGRKLLVCISIFVIVNRSDALLPVRGRKLLQYYLLQRINLLFRYLNPREGTEASKEHFNCDFLNVQIPHSPQGAKKAQP